MCLSEPLPPASYAQRVIDNIRDGNEPSEDPAEHADIQAFALTNQPLDNDHLAAATREVGRIDHALTENELRSILIDDSRQVPVVFAYDEIFTSFMARRANRPFVVPTHRVRDFARKWLESLEKTPDLVHEVGEPPNMKPDFPELVRKHLPAKLDFESWIGKMAFEKLSERQPILSGNLMYWETWMGTSLADMDGRVSSVFFLKHYQTFLGVGGEGRPVWRQNQWGVPRPVGAAEAIRHMQITTWIKAAEKSLISLSIQIANWLALWLIDDHAHDLAHERGRRDLTGADVVMAVVEILGDEWFELLFDDEGKLKKWKLMRSLPIDEEDYFHILD